MEFRDLKKQYQMLKEDIDVGISEVFENGNFISGYQVTELEEQLAEYVGVNHCITCANGTDALIIALMTWEIGAKDAVFVPDFTFFASAEAPAYLGATPVFVDVDKRTFNICAKDLEGAIKETLEEGRLTPKVIISVNLFGQPAEYTKIRAIADKYKLLLLEDNAQGFGGRISEKRAGSFGDISTTSFFPAKPLGCYGDGGAIFTDNSEWAQIIRSICVHGKGTDKYDNVRLGMNSRLDTVQAAILKVKLKAFCNYELERVNEIASVYTNLLTGKVITPLVKEGYYSSWAQYCILLKDEKERAWIQQLLQEKQIPSMIYYSKGLHEQGVFRNMKSRRKEYANTEELCRRILALPINLYASKNSEDAVAGILVEGTLI